MSLSEVPLFDFLGPAPPETTSDASQTRLLLLFPLAGLDAVMMDIMEACVYILLRQICTYGYRYLVHEFLGTCWVHVYACH